VLGKISWLKCALGRGEELNKMVDNKPKNSLKRNFTNYSLSQFATLPPDAPVSVFTISIITSKSQPSEYRKSNMCPSIEYIVDAWCSV
jgi:hypothetical protein